MRKTTFFAVLIAGILLLAGCSEPPKETKREPEKPLEPLTGRQAFQQMYPAARAWQRDAQPLRVQSYNLSQIKTEKGKSGAWEATFVSPAIHKQRTWTWSAIEAEGNLHKGVFAGLEEYWGAPTAEAIPFDITSIRTDSDAAYDIAMEQKETTAYIKKNPNLPLLFILEKTRRFPTTDWRVVFGETVALSGYSVYVDAATGKFLQKAH